MKKMGKSSEDLFNRVVPNGLWVSNDYSIFKKLKGNRDVGTRDERIIKSMQAVGPRLIPITVNKNMEIIDGQGRFEALKELGYPVYYVIDPDAGIEECRWVNLQSSNWKSQDFVKSYSDWEVEGYSTLKKLTDEFKGRVGSNIVATVCGGAGSLSGTVSRKIRNGTFHMIVTEDEARESLNWLAKFEDVMRTVGTGQSTNRPLQYAVLFMLGCPGCNKERLLQQTEKAKFRLAKQVCSKTEGNIALLDKEYNYQLRNENRVDFNHLWTEHVNTKRHAYNVEYRERSADQEKA